MCKASAHVPTAMQFGPASCGGDLKCRPTATIHPAQEAHGQKEHEDCSGGGKRRGRPPVAVVTRQGGGSDVRYNLLARVVPGIGLWCWLAASPPDWQASWPVLPQHICWEPEASVLKG